MSPLPRKLWIAAIFCTGCLAETPLVLAQELTNATAQAVEADLELDALLSEEELDTLLAPVALYPDALLTQILFAATYPIDVVKAARFVEDNPDITDADRATAAEDAAWDPSVQALVAGFPTVVIRMNDNLDWTETVGDALLAQTDDVLDAVQRLRERATDTGYLTSNEAQTVIVSADDTITIEPATPEIIYVPTYASNVVYTTPAPATGVVYVDDGSSDFNDALLTGAIIFGGAMILNEIFDDDDPWGDYWRRPVPINWDNNDFYGRPSVNVNGDITFDNDRITNISRDKIEIDRDKINIGRNDLKPLGDRVGSLDREGIDRERNREFRPDADKRNEAREKLASRKTTGEGVPRVENLGGAGKIGSGSGAKVAAAKEKAPTKLNRTAVRKPAAGLPANLNKPDAVKRPANVSRPNASTRPALKKPPPKVTAFEKTGGGRAKDAANRGRASAGKGRR
jgi:hypothetical protein